MRWTDFASMLVGIVVGLFGWIILAGVLLGPTGSDDNIGPVGQVALTLLLGVAPILLGAWLVWTPFKRRARRRKEVLERKILDLAAASQGVLSPAQVARSTELTLDEAKAALDEMLLSGHCTSDMQESGQIVYRFVGST